MTLPRGRRRLLLLVLFVLLPAVSVTDIVVALTDRHQHLWWSHLLLAALPLWLSIAVAVGRFARLRKL